MCVNIGKLLLHIIWKKCKQDEFGANQNKKKVEKPQKYGRIRVEKKRRQSGASEQLLSSVTAKLTFFCGISVFQQLTFFICSGFG